MLNEIPLITQIIKPSEQSLFFFLEEKNSQHLGVIFNFETSGVNVDTH